MTMTTTDCEYYNAQVSEILLSNKYLCPWVSGLELVGFPVEAICPGCDIHPLVHIIISVNGLEGLDKITSVLNKVDIEFSDIAGVDPCTHIEVIRYVAPDMADTGKLMVAIRACHLQTPHDVLAVGNIIESIGNAPVLNLVKG